MVEDEEDVSPALRELKLIITSDVKRISYVFKIRF